MSKVFSSECKMCSFCGVGLPTTDVAAWKKTEEETLLHSLLNHFLTTLFAFSKNCHSFKSRSDASRFEMEGKNRKGNNLTVSVKFFGNFFLKKNFGNFWVEWWSLKSVLEKKEICHQGFGWKTDLHWDKSLRTCTTSTIQMPIWPKIAQNACFGKQQEEISLKEFSIANFSLVVQL